MIFKKIIKDFLALESAGGVLLFLFAITGMVAANSSFAAYYQRWVSLSSFTINDILMALFFLVVGLELKRGFLEGQFSHLTEVILPLLAAVAGMIVPACIYLIFNYQDSISYQGWSIPVATDIAFALGVLLLFGKRVNASLKLFLLALAIFDDIGGILIIAIFFTKKPNFFYLIFIFFTLSLLFMLNYKKINAVWPYLILGIFLWIGLYGMGVHPTLAGVLLALFIPADQSVKYSTLHQLEDWIHPIAVFFVMPLFALTNAGFSLTGVSSSLLLDKVVLGIALGLFVGKQLGIMVVTAILVLLTRITLPRSMTWGMLYGLALLAGIGFTMSLFLGTLSFQYEDSSYLTKVRIGVILGSISSAVMGAWILNRVLAKKSSMQE